MAPTWEAIAGERQINRPGDIDSVVAASALEHLRAFFGENTAELPVELLERLLNCAPTTYVWPIWLSNALERLSTAEGFHSLRKRLVDRNKFMEAWSVLQIAERLDAAEFEIGFDAPVNVDGERKVPDLRVRDSWINADFRCEVSVLFSANVHVRSAAIGDSIFKLLLNQGQDLLSWAVLIEPGAIDHDMGALLNRVAWEIMEVQKEGIFREVTIANVLQMALASEADDHRVRAWGRTHGMGIAVICTVPPGRDQLWRLSEKIDEEAKQLPSGNPNLLVLGAQDMFIGLSVPATLAQCVVETLAAHPKISVLVIICEGLSLVPIPDLDVSGVRFRASTRGGVEHQYLIAVNEACPHRFSDETLARIIAVFKL